MAPSPDFRHLGGGPKGLFLTMRYVFIVSAAYILVSQSRQVPTASVQAMTIAGALASNVLLSQVSPGVLFASWVAAPLLIADTAWVAWSLHAVGAMNGEFYLLYFFVVLLAALGENPLMVVLGATGASGMTIYASWDEGIWTSPVLPCVAFLWTAALFYGHVLSRIKSERERGDRNVEWAHELEACVAARTRELQRLYEASRAGNKAKTEFMASMSHEFRTPLHIVIGYADILLDGAATTPTEGATFGRHIRNAATGLLDLVDSVLEMGRFELERVHVDPRPARVGDFIDELRRREWIAPQPGVTLRWAIEASLEEFETDSAKLAIILSNLITNALKYTRVGQVTVGVEAHLQDERLHFRVEDTGPGIPAALLGRLRDPFHDSISSVGPHSLRGVGLGLAIVYRYAALLDADVRVHSTVGCGTCFVVSVPRRTAPQVVPTKEPARTAIAP
jgi:signal transduction histidine kinase